MNSDELKRKLGIDDDGTYRIDPETGPVQKWGVLRLEGIPITGSTRTAARSKRMGSSTGKIQRRGSIPIPASFRRKGSSVIATPIRESTRRPGLSKNGAGSVGRIPTNASTLRPESFKSVGGSAGRTSGNTPSRCKDADSADLEVS